MTDTQDDKPDQSSAGDPYNSVGNGSIKTRAVNWLFAQGATVVVTIGFLSVVLYIGAWRGPMVIEQIQLGYEKEHVRYTDNLKQVLDAHASQTKQIADAHEKVNNNVRELVRELRAERPAVYRTSPAIPGKGE